jgi:hypothetical protein
MMDDVDATTCVPAQAGHQLNRLIFGFMWPRSQERVVRPRIAARECLGSRIDRAGTSA